MPLPTKLLWGLETEGAWGKPRLDIFKPALHSLSGLGRDEARASLGLAGDSGGLEVVEVGGQAHGLAVGHQFLGQGRQLGVIDGGLGGTGGLGLVKGKEIQIRFKFKI